MGGGAKGRKKAAAKAAAALCCLLAAPSGQQRQCADAEQVAAWCTRANVSALRVRHRRRFGCSSVSQRFSDTGRADAEPSHMWGLQCAVTTLE